jgi:hypothetical protein
MKTFENWYTSILEEVATAPTKSLAGDVDTIISSLDTLVKELTEELDSPEFNELNEADAEGPSKVMQWIWWMPKARKAQQKVNKIKLNVTDMEAAAEDAPDPEQQKKINAKAKIARDQAGELQKMVDDKFKSKGELVSKVLSSEKIAGQIASIKRATGLEDNPEKVATYKEKMAELQKKYKEDQEAIKELEPSEEDKKAEKEKKQKEAEEAKAKQDELDAKAEAAKKAAADKEAADKEAADKEAADKAAADKEAADKEAADKAAADKEAADKAAADKEAADKAAADKEAADKEAADKGEPKTDDKNSKEGKLKRLEDMLAKAKESGDEEKIKKVQDLIDRVSAKESWQLDGTTLGMMLESEILKLEMSFTLNESRYQNLSIKDRFSRLL